MLMLVACDNASAPTAPAEAVVSTRATAAVVAAAPVSVTVRGFVVDSSDRRLANINIECLGNVTCAGPHSQPSAEGHDHRVGATNADGSYEVVATSRGDAGSGFMMNANRQGYQVEWRQVAWPDPACTSDQARCALTVNFKLTSVAD
jgi:hypothetical protein